MIQDVSFDLGMSAEASFAEGMLGEEYDFVGVFNEQSGNDDDDLEIFIVAAGSDM